MAHIANPSQQEVTPRIINNTTGIPSTRGASTVEMTDQTRKTDRGRKTDRTFPYQIPPSGGMYILKDYQERNIVIPKCAEAATTAGKTSHTARTVTSSVRGSVCVCTMHSRLALL